MLSEIFRSKIFKLFALVVLVLVLTYLGKELQKRYRINQEIKKLEDEIAALETKNKDTLELINYFKTNEFQERQARSLLNLQKEGEFVVALPFQDELADLSGGLSTSTRSNFQKWWDYFFNRK